MRHREGADPAGGAHGARDEQGGASVLTVAALGVVLVVMAAVLVVVSVVRDVHRARSAADLAALAAAGPTTTGALADCGSADAVARANGAGLTACAAGDAGSVVVSVSIVRSWPSGLRWLPGAVTARSRAGVADDDGDLDGDG